MSNSLALVGDVSASELIQRGFEAANKAAHTSDAFGNTQFEQMVKETLMGLSPELRYGLTSCYDYTVFPKKGVEVRLLQRNSFLDFDSQGKPILKLGTIYNISHLKKTNSQLCKISYSGDNHLFFKHKRNAPEIEKLSNIPKVEHKVANKLVHGFSSGQIKKDLSLDKDIYNNVMSNLVELFNPRQKANLASLVHLYGLGGSATNEDYDMNLMLQKLVIP
ncbi:MAG: hypothetical protein ACOVMN_04685 [Flexibacteraceae bacterium]